MERTCDVLFLCTANSARSILAESILNARGAGRFQAHSAGSFPRGEVRPEALRLLTSLGLPTEGLRSKSWEEFARPRAPAMDFVLTVCDQAAGEVCPVWPGQPVTARWGIPDPAAVQGSDVEIVQGYAEAVRMLERRISLLLALPFSSLDRMSLTNRVRKIGRFRPDTIEDQAS
ncbi:hypothetical protein APZ41_005325 [Roseomonas mucosa]|uniref:Phosphotyrosine protein phosphatase I domain-containing protein n=1 Tax=Roseomonas mucosa TaxID=207340 RepID=A0A1S8DA56_9PROT|nr:arsenate reductase ArsC [Roseomonas mucosa]ONH84235.1 hypothetical protein APZ41_005325 [Roseomonas mucosa]